MTHASDRPLWTFRLPVLTNDQVPVAREWLGTIAREVAALESIVSPKRSPKEILVLTEEKKIEWGHDALWEHLMRLRVALPGETTNGVCIA